MTDEPLGCHEGLCFLELSSFVLCSCREMKRIHGIGMIMLTVQQPKEVRFTIIEVFGFVFFFLCVNSV
jgi:hypothetical protein